MLRATLPAGTVSGAPKVRAMEIIDALEPTKRGPYAGVVGYLDFSGNLDTAIAIRTMFVGADGRASVQAGAGIVADSDPGAEDDECHNKAAALLAAVPAARRMRASQHRWSVPSSPDLSTTTVGRRRRCPRDVSSRGARGPDATHVPPGPALPAGGRPGRRLGVDLLLQPQGKVVAFLRLTRAADEEYVLDTDGGWAPAVVERLNRFKLRVKADIEVLEGWRCLAVRGPGAHGAAPGAACPPTGPDGRASTSSGPAADVQAPAGVPVCSIEAYEVARIEAGVPAMGRELDESHHPRRGRHRRPLGQLHQGLLHGPGTGGPHRLPGRQRPPPAAGRHRRGRGTAVPPVGATVHVVGDDKEVGVLTSVARSTRLGAPVALAYVRRAVEPPAEVELRWDGGTARPEVVVLPLVS